jgi:hypothetical protein
LIKLCIPSLLTANLVLETFHAFEIKSHKEGERRAFEDLNYLSIAY